MNSMYGGESPAGPSGAYGSGSTSTVAGSRTESSSDAAYYQVARGEYGHHYATGGGQYEVLSRAVVHPDGIIQDAQQSYYSLEPHRPIALHPSSRLAPLSSLVSPTVDDVTRTDQMTMPKREGSPDLERASTHSSNGRTRRMRGSRSKSTSLEGEEEEEDDEGEEGSERFEKEMSVKKRKADQARARYHRMNEEQRKEFNLRRRMKQREFDDDGQILPPTPKAMEKIHLANKRKAEAARAKYHQMTDEEKREYNAKRTDAFRKKRQEEDELMASPATRITEESYAKAQAIMSRNSRKAHAARERYARMTPSERKEYNQRRAELKKQREREMIQKRLMEEENMQGMRIISSCSLVDDREAAAAGLIEFEQQSMIYPKKEEFGIERREEEEEMVEEVEVELDDDSMLPPAPPPSAPLLPLPSPVDGVERRGRTRGGVKVQRTKTAERIIREVAEAEAAHETMMEYGRRRSEYDEAWSLHPGSSLGGVIMEDGSRVVYADERTEHIEVDDDLHHMQARSASAGVYEYAEHQMDDHYGEGPDMVQHEVEVPHSPHHRLHHVHHMEGDIDVEHGDDEDMRAHWEAESQLLDRPYQPRDKTLLLSVVGGGGGQRLGRGGGGVQNQQRLMEQRARRALRSRIRYANMTEEEKARHNATRAAQLRESRRRDLQLLQMADGDEQMGMDEHTRKMVELAQERRTKRAEQARHKYRRMSEDERRAYNAMRDAQRRSRRRDMMMDEGEESGDREIRRVRGGGSHARTHSTSSSSSAVAAAMGGVGQSSSAAAAARGVQQQQHHSVEGHHLQQQREVAAGVAAPPPPTHYYEEMYEQDDRAPIERW